MLATVTILNSKHNKPLLICYHVIFLLNSCISVEILSNMSWFAYFSLKRGRLWRIPLSNISKPCSNLLWSGCIEEATLHCSVLPDYGGVPWCSWMCFTLRMGLHSSLMYGPTGTRNLRHLAAGVGWSCGVVPPPPSGAPDSPLTDNSCWESLPPLQATVPWVCSLCHFFSTKLPLFQKPLESWCKYSLGTKRYLLISVALQSLCWWHVGHQQRGPILF